MQNKMFVLLCLFVSLSFGLSEFCQIALNWGCDSCNITPCKDHNSTPLWGCEQRFDDVGCKGGKLANLNLTSHYLTWLPDDIGKEIDLDTLVLDGNYLDCSKHNFKACNNETQLDCTENTDMKTCNQNPVAIKTLTLCTWDPAGSGCHLSHVCLEFEQGNCKRCLPGNTPNGTECVKCDSGNTSDGTSCVACTKENECLGCDPKTGECTDGLLFILLNDGNLNTAVFLISTIKTMSLGFVYYANPFEVKVNETESQWAVKFNLKYTEHAQMLRDNITSIEMAKIYINETFIDEASLINYVFANATCDPGYYAEKQRLCKKCENGWSDGLFTECKEFINVTNCRNYSTETGNCSQCKAGFALENTYTCVECTEGTWSDGFKTVCENCSEGCVGCYVQNGNCKNCSEGYRMQQDTCLACEAGQWSKGGDMPTCRSCSTNWQCISCNSTEGCTDITAFVAFDKDISESDLANISGKIDANCTQYKSDSVTEKLLYTAVCIFENVTVRDSFVKSGGSVGDEYTVKKITPSKDTFEEYIRSREIGGTGINSPTSLFFFFVVYMVAFSALFV